MVIRYGKKIYPQATRGLRDMRGERWCRRREIERGRGSTAIRKHDKALACCALAEGRLLFLRHGNGCCAITGRGGFHRRDDAVTERHQDDEDAKEQPLVPGTGEPPGASLSCRHLLRHVAGHEYRAVAGGVPQGGQSARFPRASSSLRCLAIILMAVADSSSLCAGQARMGQ